MPELKIPKGLTPQQEKELKENFHNDLAAKQNEPPLPPVPQSNA